MSCAPPSSLETVAPRYTHLSMSFIPYPFTFSALFIKEFIVLRINNHLAIAGVGLSYFPCNNFLIVCVLLGHGHAYPMRWCTTSDEEQSKCHNFTEVLKKIDSTTEPGCVKAENAVECMRKISGGDADLITLDGGDVYKAGKI